MELSPVAIRPNCTTLPPELRARLAVLVAQEGEAFACQFTHVHSTSLSRALAGLGIRRSTVVLIALALGRDVDAK